ncbi:MAG: spore cortex biosynthesis protein YabQ [Clostridium sp.]|nr:spore cortex biosynthesis protein YabQ [Clostridium sp.]
MGQNIVSEVTFLFHSFVLGAVITFAYDGFVILRRLIKHSMLLISLEDMIFWIACAIGVFYMLYEENNGILRWFAVFGATLGMIAYKASISPFVVGIVSAAAKHIFHGFLCLMRLLLKPIRFLARKIKRVLRFFSKKGKKVGKCVKNKLTGKLKLLKITLCKH